MPASWAQASLAKNGSGDFPDDVITVYLGWCKEEGCGRGWQKQYLIKSVKHQKKGPPAGGPSHGVYTEIPLRTMGQTLQPIISPKQNRNRSLMLLGSWSFRDGNEPERLVKRDQDNG